MANKPSFFNLPRELRDCIYSYALDVRVDFAYGDPADVLSLLDPNWRRCEANKIRHHELSCYRHIPVRYILEPRLISSAIALLCVSKTIKLEAEPLLRRAEVQQYFEDVNNVREWSFKPNPGFLEALRRSRFVVSSTYDNATFFFNQMPRSMRQHITSVCVTREALLVDPSEMHNTAFTALGIYDSPELGENIAGRELSPLAQALLRLPELREIAIYSSNDLADYEISIDATLADLLSALLSSHLQRLHVFTDSDYPVMVWDTALEAVPTTHAREYTTDVDLGPAAEWLFDVHHSDMPVRDACRVTSHNFFGTHTPSLKDIASSDSALASIYGDWRKWPNAESVISLAKRKHPSSSSGAQT